MNNKISKSTIKNIQILFSIYKNFQFLLEKENLERFSYYHDSFSYIENNNTYYSPLIMLEGIRSDPEEQDYFSMCGYEIQKSLQSIFTYHSKTNKNIKNVKNGKIARLYLNELEASIDPYCNGYKYRQTIIIDKSLSFKNFFDKVAPNYIKNEIQAFQLNNKLSNNKTKVSHNHKKI